MRLLVLDTTNDAGHYEGSIERRQLEWLERRLIEVHGEHLDPMGQPTHAGNHDRLVVICSHHPSYALTNARILRNSDAGSSRVLRDELMQLLQRFPNVILWVNGHRHRNRVHPGAGPSGRCAGFWEVSTSSLVDWPCQGRLIEVVDNGNGTLSIFCTMIDYAAPPDPDGSDGLSWLAAIHRELAANDPTGGMTAGFAGSPEDRTVELVLAAPFSL
jgi:hypothetical protein